MSFSDVGSALPDPTVQTVHPIWPAAIIQPPFVIVCISYEICIFEFFWTLPLSAKKNWAVIMLYISACGSGHAAMAIAANSRRDGCCTSMVLGDYFAFA
jgi:hypothetical protein